MVKLRVDTRLDRFHVVFREQQKVCGDTVVILVAEQFDAFLVGNLDAEASHHTPASCVGFARNSLAKYVCPLPVIFGVLLIVVCPSEWLMVVSLISNR